MSSNHYPIVGWGVNFDDLEFKEDLDMYEVEDEIDYKTGQLNDIELTVCRTQDIGTHLIFYYAAPWGYNDRELILSKQELNEILYGLVKDYLADTDFTKFSEHCKDINAVDWS